MKKIINRTSFLFLFLSLLILWGCNTAPPINHSPTITSSPVTTATVGVPYSYDVEATDSDGDTLTYSLTTKPSDMTINSSTGLINWTPSTEGNETVIIQVSDGELTNTQSFIIDVLALLQTGTANIVVTGNWKYDIKMDGKTYFYNKPAGTHTINDVPIGNHYFETIDTRGASWGYHSVTKYIFTGSNYVYQNPVPTVTTATVQIKVMNYEWWYDVYLDGNASTGIWLGTTNWKGEATFEDISTGSHSFYVKSVDIMYDGYKEQTIYPGNNTVEIDAYSMML